MGLCGLIIAGLFHCIRRTKAPSDFTVGISFWEVGADRVTDLLSKDFGGRSAERGEEPKHSERSAGTAGSGKRPGAFQFNTVHAPDFRSALQASADQGPRLSPCADH